jgi:hypothetical protein
MTSYWSVIKNICYFSLIQLNKYQFRNYVLSTQVLLLWQVTFGALLSEPPRLSDVFYGTGESWLFSFKTNSRRIYTWSGQNSFFIQVEDNTFPV